MGIAIRRATSDDVSGPAPKVWMTAFAVWLAIARAIFCARSSPG